MPAEQLPPLERPLDIIAANLAHEGVPVQAIARALTKPFAIVMATLQYFVDVGHITAIPAADWPGGQKRTDRLPQFMKAHSEPLQVHMVQRALKTTQLEASFMLVLLKREDADKDTLHYVIETQRAMRRTRPNKFETTDPKMVDVVICHLRKRLKPFRVTIKTLWGRGYYLDDENRAKVEAIIATVKDTAPRDFADS